MIALPPGTRGLVFDCDGTLIDSMPLHKRLWAECLARHGVILPEGFVDTHAGKPTRVIIDIINRDLVPLAAGAVAIESAAFQHEKESLYLERIAEALPIEPVVATAREQLGRLPMAVVSGGCRMSVGGSLRALGIESWFSVVLTSDDAIAPKPAPDLFLQAAEQLGIEPTACHAFEDADAGIAAALAAGMTVTDVRLLYE
ncbi:HAD family hydrolase [Botrimarina hoheduenensis]|uniref:Fructose-1-phosphate phosphatase YqaB n=1 Tax=Botrimarina hoheduenensis TaxID=2528000 RepID=A0A5C5WDG8_9BACT|nr:HAD family phosphatase [Botrimarina hoheduenensis]TWT48734.1 Fructose-1-phosphate phosphatase YqaB [Botrimarina hoheduenensis]